ncbi:YqiA/YcfP family alpha/beta fold hydrolase [Litorilituus lipolyticus]|uniref:Esterase YqiA n=1 Tax=Litorilituus lipolyticus TaxID=2491017 RepID=A0A502L608_9GAMM|nr:YqiA/YcfP family alpha/beta fold hydrolase [Litorilituus lipolyticus]TPH18564.1 esterase YqiA [Litorilituus lipolyticus]
MTQQHILYIHGFNSSPLSIKAEQTRGFFAKYYPKVVFHCPQVATTPSAALQQLEDIVEQSTEDSTKDSWALIGSSLGGYFSNYLSEKYDIPAVLINPSVTPYKLLSDYIGEQKNPYTDEVYFVTEQHMHQLKAIEQVAPKIDSEQKNNYLVMVQTGDEVLDYQQAATKYQYCQLIVEQGGDHSFIDYEQHLPAIADFLQLK